MVGRIFAVRWKKADLPERDVMLAGFLEWLRCGFAESVYPKKIGQTAIDISMIWSPQRQKKPVECRKARAESFRIRRKSNETVNIIWPESTRRKGKESEVWIMAVIYKKTLKIYTKNTAISSVWILVVVSCIFSCFVLDNPDWLSIKAVRICSLIKLVCVWRFGERIRDSVVISESVIKRTSRKEAGTRAITRAYSPAMSVNQRDTPHIAVPRVRGRRKPTLSRKWPWKPGCMWTNWPRI